MKQAGGSLSQQAKQVIDRGDRVFKELDLITRQVDRSSLPFCSDADLAHLGALTFGSLYLKDIGRTSKGKLYCSAFLGRLDAPYVEGPPTLRLNDSTQIYSNVDVVFASSNHDHGTILERNGIDIVLAPSLFRPASETSATYQVIGINRETSQFATLDGTNITSNTNPPVEPESWRASGRLYHSECSSRYALCTAISAPIIDLMRPARGMVGAYTLAGSFIGLSVALSLALWLARYKQLEPRLQRAIRNRSFEIGLLYQPIVDITSQKCVGAEALMRWTDTKGHAVPPDVFIAVAEKEGFISDLTAFVVERGIRELGEHLRADSSFTLSLNIAAVDLSEERSFTLLQSEVKNAGILPRQIALELTERSTADVDSICVAIQRLRKLGVKVNIDDFGTGFSSLSYLDRLNVDAINIDRAFTRTIGTDAVTSSIIPQMLAMAKTLHLEVIVEGVESQVQNDFLESSHDGLRAQGWHFGRPMSASALGDFKDALPACSRDAVPDIASGRIEGKQIAKGTSQSLLQNDQAHGAKPIDQPFEDLRTKTTSPPVDILSENGVAKLVPSAR